MTGRRSAPVISDGVDHLGREIEILRSERVYAVCFNGSPVSVRFRNTAGVHAYAKTLFSTIGHARLLALRLNRAMGTDAFTVKGLD